MTSYSPLESLLLFQALRHQNTHDPFSFNKISNQLKNIPLISDAPGYDSGRLSPDALRDLYLSLLKEEVKRDLERQSEQENGVANNEGSRKRKAPSPPMPTVQEAAQHSHLIPQLVTRLYANYREKAVREIREYERQYSALQREIKELEDGQKEEQLAKQQPRSATQSPKPSTFAHTQPLAARPVANPQAATATPSAASPTSAAQAPSRPYAQAKIDAVINHGPEPNDSPAPPHRRASSNTKLPPLSEMAPQSPRFGIPPTIPKQMPHMQQQTFSHSPPSAHQSPYISHHAHPAPGPPMQNNMPRPSSRHDPSPRPILPPPPGMPLPPPNPPQHLGSPNMHAPMPPQQHYQKQHRGSIGPTAGPNQTPFAHQPQMQHPPTHQGYYQQSPYQDRRASYPQSTPQPVSAGFPPHQPPPRVPPGGRQLEPFYMGSPDAGKQQQRQALPLQAHPSRMHHSITQTPRQPMYQQYPPASATAPVQTPRANPRMSSILSALATPLRPEYMPTWKSERRPPLLPLPSEPLRPDIEPLSPVGKTAQPARLTSTQEIQATKELPPPQQGLRPPKSRRRATRAGSPSSVASSTIGESTRRSTRSQSVSTVVGANLLSDGPGSVKDEPSTPAGVLDHPDHHPESSATPASGMMTRKRRGTIASQTQHPPKRRRQESSVDTHDGPEDVLPPPAKSNTVTAYRNFAKVSSTLMNDIASHKHASYFAGPVRDRDANGYSDIIKQPQHLKAIRSAITAGTRAVAQATANDSLEATPTSKTALGDSMAVDLERSEDLMPPKAIVNGAQLEKEVYRMLANAVMFNPGEDGLVAETREMFEDIKANIRDWRGIPGEGEAGEEKEEVVEESKGKRRKL